MNTTTDWRCVYGHQFQRCLGTILKRIREGKRNTCPECTHKASLDESDYIRLAKSVGVEWLGPLPKTSHHGTTWKCSKGHIFLTSYKSVSHRGRFASCAQCKVESFIGPGHPRWRGGWDASAAKHRNRLKRYNLIERNNADADILTKKQWKQAKKYFCNACAYCGKLPRKFQKDHFIPIATGGQHTAKNVIPVCPSCNHSKGGKNPIEWLTGKFGFYEGAEIYHSILLYFGQLK